MKTIQKLCLGIAIAALSLPLMANPPLKVGDAAPMFSGFDQDGNKWSLAEQVGKSMVLLYFYPKDNTPGCTAEACSIRDKMADFKQAGVEVVGVSFDDKDSHKDFIFKYNLDFPLLTDTNGVISDAYGARMAGDRKLDRRVTFLIGLNGKILHITDSPDPTVHLKELAAALADASTKPTQ